MIINTMTAMNQPVMQGTAQAQTDAVSGMEGGGFAELLLQLFGGMDSSGEVLDMGSLDELLAGMESGDLPAQEGEDTDYTDAMQMMAAFLTANGIPWVNPVAENGAATESLVQAVASPLESSGQMTTLLQTVAQTVSGSVQLEQAVPTESFRQVQTVEGKASFAETAEASEAPGDGAAVLPMTVEKGGSSKGQSGLFDGQMSFRESVAQAKKALQEEQSQSPAEETVDITALQQKVNAERTGTTAALREKTNTFQTQHSVVSQVKDTVLKNLADGKEEFVMKLKPENLGEILVKMTQEDGKISMSIVTASAQTAKLLNESVEALRNSLRPLQAEVREIIPRAEQAEQSQQSGFFGSGFENFQHQQFYNREQPHYGASPDSLTEDPLIDELLAEELGEETVQTGRLNAYI